MTCTCPPILLQLDPSPTCPTHGCTCGTYHHPQLLNQYCWVHGSKRMREFVGSPELFRAIRSTPVEPYCQGTSNGYVGCSLKHGHDGPCQS